MVIKLKSKSIQAPSPSTNFTEEQIDQLFLEASTNWAEFYKKSKFEDIYQWCVFPLLKKDGPFHRCMLHPTVEVNGGNKMLTYKFENIHFAEFVSHCVSYKPEEHKQYIKDILLKQRNVTTTDSSTTD